MKNGVTLTPEGEILYEHISKAVELIEKWQHNAVKCGLRHTYGDSSALQVVGF